MAAAATASLCGVLAMAVTSTAQAKPRHAGKVEVQRADTSAFIYLGTRKGYRIGLLMPSDRVAIFLVEKSDQEGDALAGASSAYAVHNRGSLAHGVIRARLGSLGRIFLRYRPEGRVEVHKHIREGCSGRPSVTEYGTFVGHVSFDGEGGYLRASFTKGGAEVSRSFRLKCKKGLAEDLAPKSLWEYLEPDFSILSLGNSTISLLYAGAHADGRYIGLRAAHKEGGGPGAEVEAVVLEPMGEMAIRRRGYVEGSPGTLLTSLPGAHPATATLAPPAPFFGEANYLEKSVTSHSWIGTLGVNLPGLTLLLTGPEFSTSLCVISPLKAPGDCDLIKPNLESERRLARPGRKLR